MEKSDGLTVKQQRIVPIAAFTASGDQPETEDRPRRRSRGRLDSALATLEDVNPQLGSHLNVGFNVGLTEAQLRSLIAVVDEKVGKRRAQNAAEVLTQVVRKRHESPVPHAAVPAGDGSASHATVTVRRKDAQVVERSREHFTRSAHLQRLFEPSNPARVQRVRHLRRGCANGLALPPGRPAADRHGRNRLGPAVGRACATDPGRRRRIDPSGRQALARRHGDDRDDPHRDSGAARRMDRPVDGERQRPAVLRRGFCSALSQEGEGLPIRDARKRPLPNRSDSVLSQPFRYLGGFGSTLRHRKVRVPFRLASEGGAQGPRLRHVQ